MLIWIIKPFLFSWGGKDAIFAMQADKCPGPDELTAGFYQTYWDIAGPNVISICL